MDTMKKFEEKNFIKKVRAKSKNRYYRLKDNKCFVCGSNKNLELHHILPLAEIVKNYLSTIDTGGKSDAELVYLIVKDCNEIFDKNNVVTLCRTHHYYLHNLFGLTYSEKQAKKVKNYLIKQRSKVYG